MKKPCFHEFDMHPMTPISPRNPRALHKVVTRLSRFHPTVYYYFAVVKYTFPTTIPSDPIFCAPTMTTNYEDIQV